MKECIFYGPSKINQLLKDSKESPYAISAFMHVYINCQSSKIETLYKNIFKECGVTKNSIEVCALITKEHIRQFIKRNYD